MGPPRRRPLARDSAVDGMARLQNAVSADYVT